MAKLTEFFKYVNKKFSYVVTVSVTGDLKMLQGREQKLNRLFTLLSIPKGTYMDDPEIGTKLHTYIFEPSTDVISNNVMDDIKRVMSRYENEIILNSVNSSFSEDSKTLFLIFDISFFDDDEDGKFVLNLSEYSKTQSLLDLPQSYIDLDGAELSYE